jgi:hypothetical protein
MKTKCIFLSAIFLCILHACMTDKAYDNLTIKNESKNYLVNAFLNDTLEGEKWVYDLIRLGNIGEIKKNCPVIEPKSEYIIGSLSDWNKLVDKDTSSYYIYLVDLNMIDSLKRNNNDSVTIKNKALKLIKATYADLKKKDWMITYP